MGSGHDVLGCLIELSNTIFRKDGERRNLDQYFTPMSEAADIIRGLELTGDEQCLDPFSGSGVFLTTLLTQFRFPLSQVHGIEFDEQLQRFTNSYCEALTATSDEAPTLSAGIVESIKTGTPLTPPTVPITHGDTLVELPRLPKDTKFDVVFLNPPFFLLQGKHPKKWVPTLISHISDRGKLALIVPKWFLNRTVFKKDICDAFDIRSSGPMRPDSFQVNSSCEIYLVAAFKK